MEAMTIKKAAGAVFDTASRCRVLTAVPPCLEWDFVVSVQYWLELSNGKRELFHQDCRNTETAILVAETGHSVRHGRGNVSEKARLRKLQYRIPFSWYYRYGMVHSSVLLTACTRC